MEDLNKRIVDLWDKNIDIFRRNNLTLLIPGSIPEDKSCKFLVIGLNPSFSDVVGSKLEKKLDENKITLPSDFDKVKLLPYYEFNGCTGNYPERQIFINRLDEFSFEIHPYFSRYKTLSTELFSNENAMLHLNLYQFRQAKQQKIEDLQNGIIYLEPRKGKKKRSKKTISEIADFFSSQSEITISKIKTLNPKIILIGNALASRTLMQKLKPSISEFIDEIGSYKLKNGDEEALLFFSGMLTGKGALDNFSFDRLKWHMKHSLKGSLIIKK